MAKKKEAAKDSAPKKDKFDTYVRTEKFRTKVFEKGDEDGFSHISGFDASMAKSEAELIPYVDISGDKKTMHFGQGYIVIDESGTKALISDEEHGALIKGLSKE